jgi:hypothetical protein
MVGIALKIYGHPFTFVVALLLVIFFLGQSIKNYTHLQDIVRDVILSITFLSFFYHSKGGKQNHRSFTHKNK